MTFMVYGWAEFACSLATENPKLIWVPEDIFVIIKHPDFDFLFPVMTPIGL